MSSNKEYIKFNKIKICGIIISILLLEVFFFRGIIGTEKLIGDSGDARLNNLICEHWFQFFIGKEPLTSLNIFYPVTNTLSYTDMLFGFALPYSLLRLFSVNIYTANVFVLMSTHIFGSFSMFYFLRKKLNLRYLSVYIGLFLFSYSSGYYNKSGHTQLFAISYLPLLLIFLFNYFESSQLKWRYIWGGLCALLYSLLMYTSFYISYFTFLFSLIWIILYIIYLVKKKKFYYIINFIKTHYKEIFIIVIGFLIISMPFLKIYMPTAVMFGERNWDAVSTMLPTAQDFINVSSYNLIYGKWIDLLNFKSGELQTGYPVITLILFMLSIKWICKTRSKTDLKNYELYFATTFTIVSLWLIILKISDFSLWSIIYLLVPGASSIRAVSRINFFLTIAIAIIIAIWSDKVITEKQPLKLWIILVLAIFLENIRMGGISQSWNVNSRIEYLSTISSPPSDCSTFMLIDTSDTTRKDYFNYHLDAWEIANLFNLKTINGYSGQFPLDWLELWACNSLDVIDAAYEWCNLYNIKNFYFFDVGQNLWFKPL